MTSVPPPGGSPTPWSAWTPPPPPEPGSELTPLSRRLLATAGVLAVALIAVVGHAWLSGEEDTTLNPIAQAAERTQRSSGMRIAISGAITGPDLPSALLIHGEGAYEGSTGTTDETVTIELPGRSSVETETLSGPGFAYMRTDRTEDLKLFEGKSWVGGTWAPQDRGAASAAGTTDAGSQFEMLGVAPSEVERLGTIAVRGTPTTAYRARVDADQIADILGDEDSEVREDFERASDTVGDPEFTVWIDADGILRRVRLIMAVPNFGGRVGTMDFRWEYYEFGIDPEIELPDESDVFDLSNRDPAEFGLDLD